MFDDEYELKRCSFQKSVKKKESGEKKEIICPHCGKKSIPNITGEFAFCGECHRKLPWIIISDNEKSVKEENI